MTQRNGPPPGSPAVPGPSRVPTAVQRFARHVRRGHRGLQWHFQLGRLGLECCPPRVRHRTRQIEALAAANPPCSKSLLYKTMKFAREHSPEEVRRWQEAGVTWDHVAILLSVPPAERRRAVDQIACRRPTSRELRLWRKERYGIRPSRGGRLPAALPDHSPEVRLRTLIDDCRRLCARHRDTFAVLMRMVPDPGAEPVPPPDSLTQVRAAHEANRGVLRLSADLDAVLERILGLGEGETAVRRATQRRKPGGLDRRPGRVSDLSPGTDTAFREGRETPK